MVKTCYLDSQDYSVLTDPKLAGPEKTRICSALVDLATSGKVKFVFSAAVVSESVAISADSSHLAELKANLLSLLCGTNALISIEKLLHAEVQSLASRSSAAIDAFDPDGHWFPEFPLDEDEHPIEMLRRRIENEFASSGMSRQESRAAARKLIKNGKPRGGFKDSLTQPTSSSILAADLMDKYPMHPRYAETMARYAVGGATHKDFHDALIASLADPKWMMKWFATTHALAHPISEMVRKPGRELGELFRAWVANLIRWADSIAHLDEEAKPLEKGGEIANTFLAMQDSQLVQLVTLVAKKVGTPLGPITAKDVDIYCPGLSTCIRSLYMSAWQNVAGGRRDPVSDSQPVDAIHGFYAPYVDVFRADKYMANHIEKQASRYGTKVVPKLTQLLDALRR
jgi:hypothetical protein